jgi:ABC-type multidrug transport system ATPase subunit
MQIQLNKVSKRYNYEWIFRDLDYSFSDDNNYVIMGANGSGKSTLLQIIAGYSIASEGKIIYSHNNNTIPEEDVYSQVSIAAPYLELLDELTLNETILFQQKFKSFCNNLSPAEIVEILQLEKASNKQLKYFSSGMKQRVRLALAILGNTPLLLLDEPTSNLDKKAIVWYQTLIQKYSANRMIIVCSNQQEFEYEFCNKQLNIEDYKIKKS